MREVKKRKLLDLPYNRLQNHKNYPNRNFIGSRHDCWIMNRAWYIYACGMIFSYNAIGASKAHIMLLFSLAHVYYHRWTSYGNRHLKPEYNEPPTQWPLLHQKKKIAKLKNSLKIDSPWVEEQKIIYLYTIPPPTWRFTSFLVSWSLDNWLCSTSMHF